jgi:hypothetical protein
MTIRTFAIALALISPMVIATSYPSLAASGCINGCFKKGKHTVHRYYNRYYNYAPQPHDADYELLQEVLEK